MNVSILIILRTLRRELQEQSSTWSLFLIQYLTAALPPLSSRPLQRTGPNSARIRINAVPQQAHVSLGNRKLLKRGQNKARLLHREVVLSHLAADAGSPGLDPFIFSKEWFLIHK